MTMSSATAATARTSKKTDTDTHTGNALLEGDVIDSGDEPMHAVLVAVTTALTVAVSVTVIACITVTTRTLEDVDALLVPVGNEKKCVLNTNTHTVHTIRNLTHHICKTNVTYTSMYVCMYVHVYMYCMYVCM